MTTSKSSSLEATSEQRLMEAAVAGKRVYEYTDQDGVVYYSFHKNTQRMTPRRLVLGSRLGVHLLNFLSALRVRAEVETAVEMGTDAQPGG
jgi:hypothetical protein